jgi:hypothetical protein
MLHNNLFTMLLLPNPEVATVRLPPMTIQHYVKLSLRSWPDSSTINVTNLEYLLPFGDLGFRETDIKVQ